MGGRLRGKVVEKGKEILSIPCKMQKKREYPSIIIDIDIEVTQSCQLFVTPWTVACQAPLSMEFFRQEYWSGLPFPSPSIIISVQIIHIST